MALDGKILVTSPSLQQQRWKATVTFATVVASGYPKADAGFATASGLNTGAGGDYTLIAAGSAATANSPATSATEFCDYSK